MRGPFAHHSAHLHGSEFKARGGPAGVRFASHATSRQETDATAGRRTDRLPGASWVATPQGRARSRSGGPELRRPLRPGVRADALQELDVGEILRPTCRPLVLDEILEGDGAKVEVAPATSDRLSEGCFGCDSINRPEQIDSQRRLPEIDDVGLPHGARCCDHVIRGAEASERGRRTVEVPGSDSKEDVESLRCSGSSMERDGVPADDQLFNALAGKLLQQFSEVEWEIHLAALGLAARSTSRTPRRGDGGAPGRARMPGRPRPSLRKSAPPRRAIHGGVARRAVQRQAGPWTSIIPRADGLLEPRWDVAGSWAGRQVTH
jgi:hypothetical protein